MATVALAGVLLPLAGCGGSDDSSGGPTAGHRAHRSRPASPTSASPPSASPSTSAPPGTAGATSTATASPSGSMPPRDWAEVFGEASTGVVRIDVRLCDGNHVATGTGFQVADDLVATVAHVVNQAQRVRITSPTSGLVRAGTVIGFDLSHDLALVRTAIPSPGHIFRLQEEQPPIGSEIGMIGFPLGRSMQLTTGRITAAHDQRQVRDVGVLADMLLTDAAQNPGNSGGPWLDLDGDVIALAESGPPVDPSSIDEDNPEGNPAQGNNGGVPAGEARDAIQAWTQQPEPYSPCPAPQSREDAALETLMYYFWDINRSDYASAYAQLDSATHPPGDLDTFIEGVKTSQDYAPDGDPVQGPLFDVVSTHREGDAVVVEARFVSTQDAAHGPNGMTCAVWHLEYVLVRAAGVEAIRESRAVGGDPKFAPCPVQ